MTTIFSDNFDGTNGAAWSASWTSSVTTGTGASSTIQGNRGRLAAGSTSTGQVVRRYSGANQTDVEFSGTFIFNTSSTAQSIEIWVRGDDATNNGNGYFLYLTLGNKPHLAKGAGFTYPDIATLSSAPTLAQGTEYSWKLYAVGTTIKAKVWQTSGGEPGSYDYSGTDSTHTGAGQVWISFGNRSGTASQTADFNDALLTDGQGVQTAAGTAAASAATSGTVTAKLKAAGTAAATATTVGNAVRWFSAAGTSPAVVTTSGSPTKAPPQVSGTVSVVAGTSGTLGASRRAVAGTAAASATTSGTVAWRARVTGTAAATTGVTGNAKAIVGVSGTVTAVTGVSGGLVVTGKPGQGNQILELFNADEVLTGGRVTYYQFDLLDPQENLVGQLVGVTAGDIAIDAYSAVKATGKLTVYTDPIYSHLAEGQPDFLGVQINTLLGPTAAAAIVTTTAPIDSLTCTDADAVDISVGDQVILTDSSGQPKQSTVFTITLKEDAGVDRVKLSFTPDAAASIAIGDIIKVVSVSYTNVVDWLNVRIRPMIRIARLGGGDDPAGRLVPAGVFLCAAPVESWDANGLRREIELIDKLSILDQDIASGDPDGIAAYAAPAGANVIDLVTTLIGETGELSPMIEPDTKVLASPMVWDVGTTRLKIINDLLDAGGYYSLWCDGYGQYQATPYLQPSERTPVYESLMPFSDGPNSLMDPAWTRDRDIYSIPNRYLVIGQGDGTTAALTSIATNVDPASPYSFPSRGRWITVVEVGVEAVDQAALDTIARARLSTATSVTNQITLQHIFLPDLHINSVVRFVNPGSQLDIYCYVVGTTIPLDPLKLCTTTMRLVT